MLHLKDFLITNKIVISYKQNYLTVNIWHKKVINLYKLKILKNNLAKNKHFTEKKM